jgi:tetratricopeptide (TPR) repeat protein
VRLRISTGLVLVAVLASAPARGQVAAPTLVEEDLPQEEPPAPARKAARPARPGEPVPEPAHGPPEPLPPARQAAPAPPAPAAAPQARPGAEPGVTIGAEDLARLQRPIEPVRTSWGDLVEWWRGHRRALREHDLVHAEDARKRLLAVKRELAIENLTPFAGAEVREAERSLVARSPDDALQHALFAVELAPDLAEAHLALARARFARDPGKPLAALGALWAGLAAAAREPHTVRAYYGDAAVALLGALLVAAAATAALLLARRLRLFLHDFSHLPLLRSGSRAQATLLALVLLALPLALRLGPFVAILVLAAAAWLYLSWRERAVATVALLVVAALPWLAWGAARATAWTGTLAERIHELERGGDSGALAARLEARAADLPAPALLALGRHHKRRGDLERALRWYEAAAAADGRSAEVRVNLGNVLFLRGDLEGAKAAYLAAVDRAQNASTLAAAHYDLSKLYLRQAAMEQSTEARKKAQQQDAAYLARYGSDDDFGANRWLVDAAVPLEQIAALARGDPGPGAVAAAVEARLAGPIPRRAWPWLPLGLTAALWLLALTARRWDLARPCGKCGRPACRRCDGVSEPLCGQCVNVYQRAAAVDPRDRALKEAQVRRHARWREAAVRILAVVGGGAGHLVGGRPVRGFLVVLGLAFLGLVVWFRQGVVPPPQPSPYTAAGKVLVAVPLAIALWVLAVRDAFRLGRGD